MITPDLQQRIENATSKALATNGPAGINVVPVSAIRVVGETIWLCNFFMDKTQQNIMADPEVALTCWREYQGLQIKATATYETDGPSYEEAVSWLALERPERTLKGLLVLTPTAIFDVSASTEQAGKKLA